MTDQHLLFTSSPNPRTTDSLELSSVRAASPSAADATSERTYCSVAPEAIRGASSTLSNLHDTACFRSDVAVYGDFDDMGLTRQLLRGVYSFGFDRPSPIQERAIVPIAAGRDVIAQAPSGTGKTGAFGIGILARVDVGVATTQAVAVSPTKELAEQTFHAVSGLGRFLDRPAGMALAHLFVGGNATRDDMRAAAAGVVCAVGTPGRLNDLFARGALRGDSVKTLVIDEADEMLSLGFMPQIREMLRFLCVDTQVVLVSATVTDQVLDVTRHLMREPVSILVPKESLTLNGIAQFFVAVHNDGVKAVCLRDLYRHCSVSQSVVFCNGKRRVDEVHTMMTAAGHQCDAIHGDLDREHRAAVMAAFRAGTTRVLIATDVVGRGIDVQHVSVVINYDIPRDPQQYLHRIGRSGRHGRKGLAINLVGPCEEASLAAIQKHYHTDVAELPHNFHTLLEANN